VISRVRSFPLPSRAPAACGAVVVVFISLGGFGGFGGFAFAQGPLALASPAAAAPTGSAVADVYGRATPQSSVFNFLDACRAGDFRKASRYLDLRDRKPEDRAKNGPVLAQQLLQILDRDSQFDLADLSNDPAGDPNAPLPGFNDLDTFAVNNTKIVLQLARVDTRSGAHIWVVSSDSLKKIPVLAAQAAETATEKRLPTALVTTTFLDTPLWQWIVYALVIAALFTASRLLSPLILTALGLVFRRFSSSFDAQSIRQLLGPLRLLASILVFRAAVEFIGGSALLRLYLGRGMTLLLFAGAAWLAGAFVDGIAERVRVRLVADQRGVSQSILPLVSGILKIALLALAILATLSSWGYNTTTLLAGVGVGGLAIALAAQKTLENLFGGISVITDRPVLVGDACRFGTQSGVVEEIGLRSTRLRTGERSVLSVPNAQFSAMVLENLSARDRFLFHQILRLRRDASAAQIRAVMDGIAKLLDAHPKVDPGTLPVRFLGFDDYADRLEITAYVKTRIEEEFLAIQTELLVSVLSVIEGSGTSLALPLSETINLVAAASAPPVPNPADASNPASN
jgi:MscS family membrane protein